MSFVQLCSENIATMLKSTTLTADVVHVILLDVPPRREQWWIDKGIKLLRILPVCRTQNLVKEGKDQRMNERQCTDLHHQ